MTKGREEVRGALKRLVEVGELSLEFGLGHPNPDVKAFSAYPTRAMQLEELAANDLQLACAYPTPAVLTQRVPAGQALDRPFTRRLMLGEGQLDFHAFDLSVLEIYRNDPRYYYETDDIRGNISARVAPTTLEPCTNAIRFSSRHLGLDTTKK